MDVLFLKWNVMQLFDKPLIFQENFMRPQRLELGSSPRNCLASY
jgi:hypothetical protein